jgi:hypothetical protein
MDVNQLKAVFDALRNTAHGLMQTGNRSEMEASKIVKAWIDTGVLREEEHLNERRQKVKKVVLDDAKAMAILADISVPVYPSD